MQIFRFIFLARSWASDRLYLSAQLSKLGRKAQQQDNPFALIIYPEGTLVSSDTRPVSKKYAEKMGFVSVPSLSTFFDSFSVSTDERSLVHFFPSSWQKKYACFLCFVSDGALRPNVRDNGTLSYRKTCNIRYCHVQQGCSIVYGRYLRDCQHLNC